MYLFIEKLLVDGDLPAGRLVTALQRAWMPALLPSLDVPALSGGFPLKKWWMSTLSPDSNSNVCIENNT